MDQNTYTRYERGEVEPNLKLLERMWKLLDLPANALFGRDPQRAYPGLAESARNYRSDPATGTALRVRRQALAWQLATLVTRLRARVAESSVEQDRTSDGPSLALVGRLFAELESDPFHAASRLGGDSSLAKLAIADRNALMAAVSEFAECAAREALSGGAPMAAER